MITIPAKILAALAALAPKTEVRFYLNGVRFEPLKVGYHAIVTDGHILVRLTFTEGHLDRPFLLEKHYADAVTKLKGNLEISTLDDMAIVRGAKGETRYALDTYRPLDVEAVIPKSPSHKTAHFNPELLSRLYAFLAKIGATATRLETNGREAAVIYAVEIGDTPLPCGLDVVVMPLRLPE